MNRFVNTSKRFITSVSKPPTSLDRSGKIFQVPRLVRGQYQEKFYNKIKSSYKQNNSWGMSTSIDCKGCNNKIKNKA